MQITVFKHEPTGQLFENEEAFNKHMAQYQAEQEKIRKKAELQTRKEEIINEPRLTITNINQFADKMREAVNSLLAEGDNKLEGLFFKNLRFTDISNSHSCPINGVQNFSRSYDQPSSYPGWQGRVTIVTTKETSFTHTVEALYRKFPGFNTGSGGYIGKQYNGVVGYSLQYELRLFIDDFPLLKAQLEKFETIKNEKNAHEAELENKITEAQRNDVTIQNNTTLVNALHTQRQKLYDEAVRLDAETDRKRSEYTNQIRDAKKKKKEDEYRELNQQFSWSWY